MGTEEVFVEGKYRLVNFDKRIVPYRRWVKIDGKKRYLDEPELIARNAGYGRS